MSINLLHGDCLKVLKTLRSNSVDSIVTDPPYGLSFMGKKWDYAVPSVDIWKECLRVLKPGGHLLAFGGTRTYHRLAVNIEDAGFEIRDQIQWIYGSGFPKSQNISIAIDKQLGAMGHRGRAFNTAGTGSGQKDLEGTTGAEAFEKHEGITPEAKQWNGWGTALKPANEPICLARKPLSEKTVAKNVLKHGTGGLNIDGSRIEGHSYTEEEWAKKGLSRTHGNNIFGQKVVAKATPLPSGRFPANVIFDEDAAAVLDAQSGVLKSGASKSTYVQKESENTCMSGKNYARQMQDRAADSGGASRFFYVAKASKKDRGADNVHPTVKPIKLMEYLIRMVTPPGGTVLDPFMGSGTTGVAAVRNKFRFKGIEIDKKYFRIAEKRIIRGS